MTHAHMLKHICVGSLLAPRVPDHPSRQRWEKAGSIDACNQARCIGRDILSMECPMLIRLEVDEESRARFAIVAPKGAAK